MQTHLPLTYEALKALCEQPPVPTIDPQTGLRVVINRHGFTTAWLEVYGRHGYMQVTVVLSDPTEWSNSVCHQSWSTSERPQLDAYGVDLPKEYWPDDLKQTYLRMLLLERNSATASRTAREVAHRFPRSRYMGRVDTFMAARVRRARLTDLMREAMRDDDTESRELGDSIRDALDNLATYSSGTAERVALALEARGWDDYIPVEADCGHVELRCDMQTIGGFGGLDEQTVCQGCWDDEVVCVEPHGGYARRDDVFYWESDDCYHLSEEPDFDEDEDDGRLSYGTDALDHLSIDRSFETRVDGDFHMGIELEVETKYRDGVRDAIEDMRDHFRSSYAIYKSDGSLSASGIEIVTQPTSLGRHVEKFSTWTPAPSLRAWDTGRCGMHVHIDSRAFSALTLGKFITFFNDTKNATFIRQIAGRHPAQDHQAQTYAGFDVDSSTISSPAKVLKGKSSSRYVMVNTSNLRQSEVDRLGLDPDAGGGSYNTIEVRIFRASLRKERLLAQLEFTHALLMFCRSESYKNLNGGAFLSWLRRHSGQYAHLAKWYAIHPKHGTPRNTAPPVAIEPADEADYAVAA